MICILSAPVAANALHFAVFGSLSKPSGIPKLEHKAVYSIAVSVRSMWSVRRGNIKRWKSGCGVNVAKGSVAL